MNNLVKEKIKVHNIKKAKTIKTYFNKLKESSEFNPNSSTQKIDLFEMLGIEIEEKTESGQMKTDRKEIDKLLKNYENLCILDENNQEYKDIKEILEIFINQSYAAIIRDTFVKNFYLYSINSVLYSNLKLFGTKTFRCTSSDPNMLNMPSNTNIFSKAFKKCLVAPKGYMIYTADLSALEDRVVANLSKDENKCSIFTDNIDGHCLNSLAYFPEEIYSELPRMENESNKDYCKRYIEAIDHGNKKLKACRQRGKSTTFGLNYGAGPKKVAKQLNLSIEEAQVLFDNYHNNLYKDITKMRNEILTTAKKEGEIHLGLGCYIKSNDPDTEVRTIFNACSQFWSILTLLTINKLHKLIDEKGYTEDIKIINTIYDSIYIIVKEDAEIIKWLNDTIIPLMTKDFLEEQIVHNEAAGEIGYNWYDLFKVENNASLEEVQKVIDEVKNGN